MAPLICELLDYRHTDLYIEPFGGACRVLLNKPRHKEEIYNDFGYGLRNFFETLSQPELAEQVISQLFEIVPSEEIFYEMLQYKLEHEQELTENMQRQFRKFIWSCCKKYESKDLRRLHSLIGKREYQSIIDTANKILNEGVLQDRKDIKQLKKHTTLYRKYWSIVKKEYNKAYKESKKELIAELEEQKKQKKVTKKQLHKLCHEQALESIEHITSDTLSSNITACDNDPVKMAVATFITYYLSRDGMGLDYSPAKNKSLNSYYNYLHNLKDIAQRFEGVTVMQLDALVLICQYCDCDNVMMYLDPSYLNPNEEDSSKDLGKGIYNRSSSKADHEALAYAIQNAKAKIVLSNYDIPVYNKYLDEEHGWKKIYFKTTTSVGGKKDNERVEVLWYNY